MKIDKMEKVVRFHIKFSESESEFLRFQGWLHPASLPETEMWLTAEELSLMREDFPNLTAAIDAALKELEDGLAAKVPKT